MFLNALDLIRTAIAAGRTAVDLNDRSYTMDLQEAKRFMVLLAGYLLEYPFIYLLHPAADPAKLDHAQRGVELELSQLILTDGSRCVHTSLLTARL